MALSFQLESCRRSLTHSPAFVRATVKRSLRRFERAERVDADLMSDAHERLREHVERWKDRAARGNVLSTDEAVEEQRRYEEALERNEARDASTGALKAKDSHMRHDTPAGS